MDDLTGRLVNGYELKECIGAGGFGAVYRAWQPAVDREVAVKVILPEYADHPDFESRFDAEAKMVARLEHPYIIPLYEYWRDETGAYLVMRWLKGGSLRDCLERGPVELAQLDQLLEQIGGALAFSHDHGVIHRDLKPENILLDEDENAYLTDFGIAKDLSGSGVTETGKIMGSVDYLSPEQAKGEPITPQTDIYALGIVLYELLTCEHPFSDSTPIQMIQKHLNDPLPLLAEKRPDLPPRVDEIIGRATAKAPEDRYPDIEALLADFRQAMLAPVERVVVPKVPAFLAEEREPIEREREVFVARERELAALSDALGAAVEGQGKVVFIVGNAGRGKTALLGEFTQRAQEEVPDLLVASGTCNAHSGVGDPYLPFRQILELLTGDVEARWLTGDVTTDQAGRLWSNFLIAAGVLAESAPDLINRLVAGPELVTRIETAGGSSAEWWSRLNALAYQEGLSGSDLEQALLFEQCSRFFRILSQSSPLMIILDDLQWGDAASISLLFHLGRSIASSPILIAAAYRPDELALGRASAATGRRDRHPLESVVNELTRTHGDITLDLAQEDGTNGRAFVDAFLDTEPNELDDEFRKALFEHTGGHSLFTVELLRTMQERGDLVRDEADRWVLDAELDWQLLPARVEAVISERIDRLDSELRQMISIASVEGEEFTAQVIARVQQLPEARALHDLAQEIGRRHRLVKEHGEVRAGSELLARFKFAHHLFQRYLYNQLSSGERRLLHRQIAEVLEDLYGEQAAEIGVALAYHYRAAGNDEKALPYLIQAGDYARDRYANDEAESYYRAALSLTADDQQRASLLKEVGRVQVRQGRISEGLEGWQEAIKFYQSSEEWNEVAWLYARSARETSQRAHDQPGALSICLEGLSAVPADLETPEMAALLHETGRAYLFSGSPDEALVPCEQALQMAEQLQAIEVLADTLATQGLLPNLDPEEAISTLMRSVELAEAAMLLRIAHRAHHNLCFILSSDVGQSKARYHASRAAEISRKRGNKLGEIASLRNYASGATLMGDLKEADRTIAKIERMQTAVGSIIEEKNRITQAARMILGGQLEKAVGTLEEQRAYFGELRDPQLEFQSVQLLAEALNELRQFKKAFEVLEEAVRLSNSLSRVDQVTARTWLSRISSLTGNLQRARQALEQAREIAGERMYAAEQGFLSWASAQLAASEGDWPNALKSFEAAELAFDRMENRWEQSRVIRDWAEAYISRGIRGDVEMARDLLTKAKMMFEEMHTQYYIAKVSERLKSLPAN